MTQQGVPEGVAEGVAESVPESVHQAAIPGGASRGSSLPRPSLSMLVVLGVFVALVLWFHAYFAQRLVVAPQLPEPFAGLVSWALLGLGALLLIYPLAERRFGKVVGGVLGWPAYVWMGCAFYLTVLLGLSDVGLWVAGIDSIDAMRVRALAVCALSTLAVASGMRSALSEPRLRRVELTIDGWPPELDGYRIAQLSDIHVGSLIRKPFLSRLVERCNALAPDAVAITGDLVDGSVHHYGDEVDPLGELTARDGVYFVTGNHDHFSGAKRWVSKVEALGISVLRNRRVELTRDGVRFAIAGVDDLTSARLDRGHGHDLDAALRGWEAATPLVLLAHHPATFDQAHPRGVPLQLSGHTHGGQMWPFGYFVRLQTRYVGGWYRRGRSQLYVSLGSGFWGPPMRLFAPAELTELVLNAPAPASVS